MSSADRTAPEQVWQVPGLRELRFAASQQILPLTGNRKPASERTHWIQPAPCSSRRRSCPGGERGDRQSSVSADPTPSRASPTGRRIAGYDYKTESFQRPRAESHTRFREIRNSNFLVPPPLRVGVFGKLPAARKRKDRQRIGSADPSVLSVPGTGGSPLETWRGRSNRSRADLAGTWTTRVQARRVRTDPTAESETESLPVTEYIGRTVRTERGRTDGAPASLERTRATRA